MSIDQIRELTDTALQYDAYREQEKWMVPYKNGDHIEGLEQVLYVCPHCGSEHTMQVRNHNVIACQNCGYEEKSDVYGFLHNEKGVGPEIRYVSDWSRMIYDSLHKKVASGEVTCLTATTKLHMIDYAKHKFVEVGQGTLTLEQKRFLISGQINGEPVELRISTEGLPTLPFSPGKYLEIQDGKTIYRCVLDDGRLVMRFINLVKIFYTRNHQTEAKEKV